MKRKKKKFKFPRLINNTTPLQWNPRSMFNDVVIARLESKQRYNDLRLKEEKVNKTIHNYKLLNKEGYFKLYYEQNEVCAICQLPETALYRGRRKNLSIDHCHKTNRVRGLLCGRCNSGLGLFKDNIDVLKRAIEYLSK